MQDSQLLNSFWIVLLAFLVLTAVALLAVSYLQRGVWRPRKPNEQEIHDLSDVEQVLEQDGNGPKVVILRNGNFAKFFRRKRLWSSAALKSYGQRFAENCQRLNELDIRCPKVEAVYKLRSNLTAVSYHPLQGETLRKALAQAQPSQAAILATELGRLIASLHNKGIYFRSLHLGNILTDNCSLGLIDVADLYFYNRPLSQSLRVRNLWHMQRYPQDNSLIFKKFSQQFLQGYAELAEPKYAYALKKALCKS